MFRHKLSRVHQHLMNYQSLDDGSIDYLLLNFFEVLANQKY